MDVVDSFYLAGLVWLNCEDLREHSSDGLAFKEKQVCPFGQVSEAEQGLIEPVEFPECSNAHDGREHHRKSPIDFHIG